MSVTGIDLPEFAKFLLEEGIDTISLVPDSIFKTTVAFSSFQLNE